MANYTEEQLMNVIKILSNSNSDNADEAEKKAAEEAAKAAAAEVERKAAEEAAKNPSEEQEEVEEPKKDDKTVERENKFILKNLKADLTSNGIDGDLVDSIGEFIAYDTLKDDKGEANDELVEKLVETLSSIALRQPPKGGKKRDILNSDKEGLGKYLPQNDK
ncbi:hypothetical protein KIMCHI1738_15 [Corynebacterium phage Kimchi1738]|uniref:Uncharacterized protein n=2 Tax=Ceetrepovirus TaxID=2560111 RepID=A0A3G3LWI7_9CAUD|nr:hypothetical protein FDJ10_gp15 [Corynebacterium phage C3PO]YP_010098998.1 hypothetical protein KNU16_gp15 [Corynebacterium phage Kimchi1738]ATW58444.1 hypothetical protein SEA_C3PO_15 [Corynebacterium phage C3PO]AYQ98407.1 hypothetical protein KIMCHI1738_15 [Corynebacterium phage Kimchi1738]